MAYKRLVMDADQTKSNPGKASRFAEDARKVANTQLEAGVE